MTATAEIPAIHRVDVNRPISSSFIKRRRIMFERVSQLAEEAANNVSRRQFLGRLGRAAGAAAGMLGGLLLCPMDAHAGRRDNGNPCTPDVKSHCPDGHVVCCPKGTKCRTVAHVCT